jgi:hypothetical protein
MPVGKDLLHGTVVKATVVPRNARHIGGVSHEP